MNVAQKRARHAVERLTFGPRPGDVHSVATLGVDRWIELQLHPDRIEDNALELRLAPYRTLNMSTRDLVVDFPSYDLLKAAREGKFPLPSDPCRHAVYVAGIARLQRQEHESKAAVAVSTSPLTSTLPLAAAGVHSDGKENHGEEKLKKSQPRQDRQQAITTADDLVLLDPEARMQRILGLSADEQAVLLRGLPGTKRQAVLSGLSPDQRETVLAIDNPQAVVNYELQSATLLRAVYSERQLQEVLADFWFNHFNVFLDKLADRYLLTAYERDVIRPHVLGKFKDLPVATATSSAMLFYLDNWESQGPDSPAVAGQKTNRHDGLNENYARELMELHTLGVNGGYTQQDVTEVARVFTGWTFETQRNGSNFHFNPRMHQPGAKIVLGQTINDDGMEEGKTFGLRRIIAMSGYSVPVWPVPRPQSSRLEIIRKHNPHKTTCGSPRSLRPVAQLPS